MCDVCVYLLAVIKQAHVTYVGNLYTKTELACQDVLLIWICLTQIKHKARKTPEEIWTY